MHSLTTTTQNSHALTMTTQNAAKLSRTHHGHTKLSHNTHHDRAKLSRAHHGHAKLSFSLSTLTHVRTHTHSLSLSRTHRGHAKLSRTRRGHGHTKISLWKYIFSGGRGQASTTQTKICFCCCCCCCFLGVRQGINVRECVCAWERGQGASTTQTYYKKTKHGTDGGGGRQKHGSICFFGLVEGKQARHENRFHFVFLGGSNDFIFVSL